MTLQQLRYLCAIVDESFSITRAAAKLHTSQPGISKQLKLLEIELGTKLIQRKKNRTVDLSAHGYAILPLARRTLKVADTIKQIIRDVDEPTKGKIVIATTHVHARYSLLSTMISFRALYPRVQVHFRLGSSQEIAYWVSTGEADLAIGAATTRGLPGLATLPCLRLRQCIITPAQHPLLKLKCPSLEAITRHPIISTGMESRITILITERCASFGLKPNIAMHALDLETVKKYVELGFGIAIVPTVAIDLKRERGIRVIDASHIFEPAIASIITHDEMPSRQYISDFVDLVAPRYRGKRIIQDLPKS